MAAFYTHLGIGQEWLLDGEGREFADLTLVKKTALREIRNVIADFIHNGEFREDIVIAIADQQGHEVARVTAPEAVDVRPAEI